jgi:Transposase Tn5 dimerisation domain/Transposase DNA-binding
MANWPQREFSTVDLGDIRRNQRLKQVAARRWEAPGASQQAAAEDWTEAMGSYRLWKASAVTDEAILSAHQDSVRQRAQGNRMLLHIQDTTELDYTKHKTVRGLGPLGELSRRGLFAHGEYLLQEDGLPLGLWHCHMWVRSDQEQGQSKSRRQNPIEEKESYRWLEGTRRACQLQELFPKQLVISLSDRESDIYESFDEFHRRRQAGEPAAHWIIRSKHNRKINPPEEEDQAQATQIKAAVVAAPLLGKTHLEIRSKEEFKKVHGTRKRTVRQARRAELEIRACRVGLMAPPGKEELSSIQVWVLLAKEINTPAGQEPIEWILLTDFQVRTLKKALQILELYSWRWTIEVFHKILKSGCQVEDHPPEDIHRLRPYLALQMVIAWRIHYVTLLGRDCPDLPADVLFEQWEWKPVVVVFCGKQAPLTVPTLQQMIIWIGKLGGHIGRKGDGPPGPKTIWKGMAKMFAYAELWKALNQSP